MLDDKIVLVTGGTGSFGKRFSRTALDRYDPEAVRIFSRGELLQAEMREDFNDERLRFLIGNVRDKDRLQRAMEDVDVVVHAAALKRVPACEYNPIEAVRTNVDGAANVIDAAIDNNVDRVIALSTDKAVQPINLYGATKLVSEKLFVQGNAYAGGGTSTIFSVVRYGNVVGSRGSVIPLFVDQREKGRLTITHEDMTRFWITLDQGVQFVLDSIERMHGGEIFVPKIPSMRIVDLAEAIAPNADKEVTGIRPGEKIDEVLLTPEESRHAREYEDYFVIEPEHPYWQTDNLDGGKALPDGFTYTSDGNERWLSTEDLCNMVAELGYDI